MPRVPGYILLSGLWDSSYINLQDSHGTVGRYATRVQLVRESGSYPWMDTLAIEFLLYNRQTAG